MYVTAYGRQKELPLQITNKIGGAYTANDVIGGLLTFTLPPGGSGVLVRWARIVDDDDEKAELTLHLFSSAPSAIADDAAFAPTVADLQKRIGKIVFQVADYETINGNATALLGVGASTDYINIGTVLPNGNLYGYLVCTATPTYTAVTDLHVTLGVWLDG
jgi:hypothetical protein